MIKTIERFPGYEFHDDGTIVGPSGKKLKSNIKKGYHNLAVLLAPEFRQGRRSKYYWTTRHRLICEAFHGPPPSPRHHAAHDDGNKDNNKADNVFWKTPKENSDDKYKHGVPVGRQKGKPVTANEKAAHIANGLARRGIPKSAETKAKMSEARKKAWDSGKYIRGTDGRIGSNNDTTETRDQQRGMGPGNHPSRRAQLHQRDVCAQRRSGTCPAYDGREPPRYRQ